MNEKVEMLEKFLNQYSDIQILFLLFKFHFSALKWEDIFPEKYFEIEIITLFWFRTNGRISVEQADCVWSRASRRRFAAQPLLQVPSHPLLYHQPFSSLPSQRLPSRWACCQIPQGNSIRLILKKKTRFLFNSFNFIINSTTFEIFNYEFQTIKTHIPTFVNWVITDHKPSD